MSEENNDKFQEHTIHVRVVNVERSKGDWSIITALLDHTQPMPEEMPIDSDQTFKVNGEIGFLVGGDYLTLVGAWHNSTKYGLQFKAKVAIKDIGKDDQDLLTFLVRGGVVRSTAKQLIENFSRKGVLDLLREMVAPPKVNPAVWNKLADEFAKSEGLAKAWALLQELELEPEQKAAVLRDDKWGTQTTKRWENNPWDLRMVRGISFHDADKCALASGCREDDGRRLRAGVLDSMRDIEYQGTGHHRDKGGHTWSQSNEILLNEKVPVREEHLAQGLEQCLKEGSVVKYPGVVVPRYQRSQVVAYESSVARALLARSKAEPHTLINDNLLVRIKDNIESRKLSDEQAQAVRMALESNVFVLTGGPGTGKTHTLKALISSFSVLGLNCTLMAPTGKAAVRMKQLTGQPASTIHSSLARSQYGRGGKVTSAPMQVVIIDESSMVDVELMSRLVRDLPEEARIILVGDVKQLAPVGPGQVLKDVLDSGAAPFVRLTRIFRQAGEGPGSTIPHCASSIDTADSESAFGYMGRDVKLHEKIDAENVLQGIVSSLDALEQRETEYRRKFTRDEIQVIAPQRNTDCGVEMLNRVLQKKWNPPGESKLWVGGGYVISKNDRVIQRVNDWDRGVANGEIGKVTYLHPNDKKVACVVNFGDREIPYTKSDLGGLRLAYCITIHSSQGSEYPCIVMPVTKEHSFMLDRALVYTGLTRATEFCGFVGQKETLRKAIERDPPVRRTLLPERLKEEIKDESERQLEPLCASEIGIGGQQQPVGGSPVPATA